ncbi:STP1 protein [Plasmodium ovale]|uniref:STP1 protein n=1 Tax=Plasmodium ovale TaxID=36330 RepID=A0A1C3KKB2_PLAOA|nr:STP1 protein [Plasmodium ovale]
MGDDSGYTTLTRYISVDFFKGMIESNIKKLINTYGHKNCGLRQEELCNKIKEIIPEKKNIIFRYMDSPGKRKWSNDWDRERSKYFDKLYKEEGFINMCFPKTYPKKNQSLDQLLSKHIDFCKEKDKRLSDLQKKSEFSVCKQYNMWIDTQRTSFTREYLKNVQKFNSQTVHKYFSTKEHPRGHDPLGTYRKSKLDCTKYDPPSTSPQIPVARAPPITRHSPALPTVKHKSQGKTESSVTDGNKTSIKIKSEENMSPTFTPHTPDSQTPSPSHTQLGATNTVHNIPVKTKALGSPDKIDSEKKESIPKQDNPPANSPAAQAGEPPPSQKDAALTPIIKIVPETTTTTSLFPTVATVKDTTSGQTPDTSSSLTITQASSLNSGSSSPSPSPSDPLLPAVVTKDHDKPIHSTTTAVTSANTHTTETLPAPSVAISSLAQPQPPAADTPPAVTASQEPGTPSSSSASTFTTAVTTITSEPAAVTTSTMSTTHATISSAKETTSASSSQEPPLQSAAGGPKESGPTTDKGSQQAVINAPKSLSGGDNGGISVSTQPDGDPVAKSDGDMSPKSKVPIQVSGHPSRMPVMIAENTLQKIPHDPNQLYKRTLIHNPPIIAVISPSSNKSVDSVNTSKGGSTVRNNKNDNSNTEPEDLSSLINIIPIILIILTSFTALFLLYKYTPFGLLLGRRRKRKKQDLKRIFKTPEKPTYEYPNITVLESEDPKLLRQTKENDVYIKLLKINRYKQEMQKRKKKNKKTLIEVHMEILEGYKKDEWELHKGDFLEICLRGFKNEENKTYQNYPNSKLTINNINEKTIEDIQKQEILWNNWMEDHRNILEQWKKEDWFQNLKNEWKNEEHMYKEKNDKLQENVSNEQEAHSIVSQKNIWKQWISKQAALIDMFNKEDWFKSMVHVQDKEKNNYHKNEYNNTSITSETELKNEKSNHEYSRSKDIIQKLMVQIHMMVLEECIKEDIIKHKELCIDNFIQDIHKQNNYDEK